MNIQEWLVQEYPDIKWKEINIYDLENNLFALYILKPVQEVTNIELKTYIYHKKQYFPYGEINIDILEKEIDTINTEYKNIKEWSMNNMCTLHMR